MDSIFPSGYVIAPAQSDGTEICRDGRGVGPGVGSMVAIAAGWGAQAERLMINRSKRERDIINSPQLIKSLHVPVLINELVGKVNPSQELF
jgi:hypothetical protein